MAKQEVVGGVSSSMLGMLANLILKLRSEAISECELEMFVNRQNPFGVVEDTLAEWSRFFHEIFGLEADLSQIKIPAEKSSFGWLVVVLEGMTAQRLYDKCRELFGARKYTDRSLNEAVTSDRRGNYAVWFRDRVEADEELRNKSANDLKGAGVPGITLEERLMLELFYWWKTKKNLDIKNVTLCSGSRDSGGRVPYVDWDGDGLSVVWCSPGHRGDCLRSRQAVS